jgi:hypothetical protein
MVTEVLRWDLSQEGNSMDPTIISILSALGAAIWSVWTWQSEMQKERDLKRDEMSADYVNTFIIATQELQRDIFRILEEDELSHSRDIAKPEGPVSQAALDILYELSIFFGWELVTFRYGPYTRDPRMIAIFAQISEALESRDRFPGLAFRFSLSERLALGFAAVRQIGEASSKPIFVSNPQFEFEEDVLNEHSERARLYRSQEVRCTLAAIDRAVAGEPLEGRERLAVLQNLLVDLLAHLENQEGFRAAYGKRGRATLPDSEPQIITVPADDVRMLHRIPGRFRLGIPRLYQDDTFSNELQSALNSLSHIKSVRVNRNAACVVVEHSADIPQDEFVQAVIARVGEQLRAA